MEEEEVDIALERLVEREEIRVDGKGVCQRAVGSVVQVVPADALKGEVEPVIDAAVGASLLIDGRGAEDLVVREEYVHADCVRDRREFEEVCFATSAMPSSDRNEKGQQLASSPGS